MQSAGPAAARAAAAGGGGRKKQLARVRTGNETPRRASVPTQRYSPEDKDRAQRQPGDATTRVVVKKRKAPATSDVESDVQVVEAHAIPVSEHSNRALLGQLDINKRFGKGYMARRPIKKCPLPDATLSSLWHAV